MLLTEGIDADDATRHVGRSRLHSDPIVSANCGKCVDWSAAVARWPPASCGFHRVPCGPGAAAS
jgi:hypothetical protein